MNDDKIIDLYFNRDEDAIKETDIIYGAKLRCLSNRILGSEEDSKECVNDTYLKTWNTIPPTRPKYFYAYLAKICRNLSFNTLDYKKAFKRNFDIVNLSEELLNSIPSSINDDLEEDEFKKLINDFLRSLSKDQRVIFIKRYFFLKSIEEISKEYHYSMSKVKTSLYRTRIKLRKYLEENGVYL